MPKNRTLTRIERLDVLTSRLKVNEPIHLRKVADELGISMSTINRDINILRERGVPIEAERGRGGGIRVAATWGIGHIALTYQETIDLLVSIAVSEKMELPMMFGNAKVIRTKLISTFSKNDQLKIKRLTSRLMIGPTSSPEVIKSYKPEPSAIIKRIHDSFVFMKSTNISYRSRDGALSKRTIEPHYMVLNYPVWYLVCWDHLRNDVRSFRCDRLLQARTSDNYFQLRPWNDFEESLKGNAFVQV